MSAYSVLPASIGASVDDNTPKSREIAAAMLALEVGFAIAVPFADIGELQLRSLVSREAKKAGKKFKVKKHNAAMLYEVARVLNVGMPSNTQEKKQ